LDKPDLLFFNTACASGLIGIVIWSWRTASTREVSGLRKRPANVGHVGLIVIWCCTYSSECSRLTSFCEFFPLARRTSHRLAREGCSQVLTAVWSGDAGAKNGR